MKCDVTALRFHTPMVPTPERTRHLPIREHRALPHRRSQCPAWLVADGMDLIGRWIRATRVQLQMTQAGGSLSLAAE